MREKYEVIGNEMTRTLGFEDKAVVLFWKAFEQEDWTKCESYYKAFNEMFSE